MKNSIDYKSRFRILKGGKIPLFVSALLVCSSLIGTNANADDLSLNTSVTGIQDINITGNNYTITDTGSINSSGSAIALKILGTFGSESTVTNNGSILITTADDITGIEYAVHDSNMSGFIINSGDINATGTGDAAGIRILQMNNASSIINSGTIIVKGESGAGGIDASNISGASSVENNGTIIANGENVTIGILNGTNISDSATIINRGIIEVDGDSGGQATAGIYVAQSTGTNNISNSGTITATIDGQADSSAYSIYIIGQESSTTTVLNDTTGKLYGSIMVAYPLLTNKGLISLPYNAKGVSSYITNFTQTSTGTLEIGLLTDGTTTPKYSQLATKNATFENGLKIKVNVLKASTNQDLLIDRTLDNVVTAATNLTIKGTLTVEDNSALLNFEYVEDGETIDLKVVGENSDDVRNNLLASVIKGGGNKNTQAATKALPLVPGVSAKLNTLSTDAEIAVAVQSTTPLTATANAEAGAQLMRGMQGVVEMRQNANIGLDSGDALLREKNVWIKPYYSSGSQDNKDGINGFDLRTSGICIGIDGEYDTGKNIGLAFFYTRADVDVNDVAQSSDMDVLSTLIYGNIPVIDDKTNFLYQLGYAWQKTSSSRTIDSALDGGNAESDYTSTTASLDLKLMRNYDTNERLLLQPIIQATYRRFDNPSYSESGATDTNLNMHTDSFDTEEIVASIGTLAHYKLDEDSSILASANVGYDFKDDIATVSTSYAGALGTTFDTQGIDNGRWNYTAGIGYVMNKVLGGELNFMYDYQAKGSEFKNNTLSAKYVMAF